jgi:GTP cyclohydrolase II
MDTCASLDKLPSSTQVLFRGERFMYKQPDLNTQATHDNVSESEQLEVRHFATANLPTEYGQFKIVAFKNNKDNKEHIAIVKGDVKGHQGVLCRIHSECLTGDVFGSLKCDCGPQLDRALKELEKAGRGIIVYMRQEGRGIGLANKIAAYSLQDGGMDTVEANHHLGFDDDIRSYDISTEMLKILGPKSIVLMTNNPRKFDALIQAGITIDERLPIKITPNKFNVGYLNIKRDKSGHLL